MIEWWISNADYSEQALRLLNILSGVMWCGSGSEEGESKVLEIVGKMGRQGKYIYWLGRCFWSSDIILAAIQLRKNLFSIIWAPWFVDWMLWVHHNANYIHALRSYFPHMSLLWVLYPGMTLLGRYRRRMHGWGKVPTQQQVTTGNQAMGLGGSSEGAEQRCDELTADAVCFLWSKGCGNRESNSTLRNRVKEAERHFAIVVGPLVGKGKSRCGVLQGPASL